MNMTKFLGIRFARLILTVFLVSTMVFFLLRVIPGDPADVIAGIDADPGAIAAIRQRLGTDLPILVQYGRWLGQIVTLDFGESLISGESVSKLVLQRFPLTLTLAVIGIVLSMLIALPLGVISAVRRWSLWDYAGMLFSQIGMAIPGFWLGIMLLLLFAVKIKIFPLFGIGGFQHLVLPSLSLAIARAAVLLRITRASMIEELGKEYVVAARAKGLPDGMVRYKHALKNALLPIITVAGIQLGYMLGGAIIIEQVFSLPGLGRLFLFAVYQRDFTLIQGGVVFVAVVFSSINFVVDMVYGVLNPRIRIAE